MRQLVLAPLQSGSRVRKGVQLVQKPQNLPHAPILFHVGDSVFKHTSLWGTLGILSTSWLCRCFTCSVSCLFPTVSSQLLSLWSGIRTPLLVWLSLARLLRTALAFLCSVLPNPLHNPTSPSLYPTGISMEIALNLQLNFNNMSIFKTLVLLSCQTIFSFLMSSVCCLCFPSSFHFRELRLVGQVGPVCCFTPSCMGLLSSSLSQAAGY